jgi:hypothetical protein
MVVWIDGLALLRVKPPCPAFWGVAPRNMKTGMGWSSLEAYFRVKFYLTGKRLWFEELLSFFTNVTYTYTGRHGRFKFFKLKA